MQFMQRAKQQMTVLRALDEADGPLSARELWSRLSGTGVGLATVYRALQRGVEEGTLESVEGLGGGVRYEPKDREHHRVLIWSAAEGQVSRAIDVGSGWVENVAWSPDGQWLAASCSRQVRAYDADGAEVWRSDDHPSTVSAIAWASVGELATACYGRVTFFDCVHWRACARSWNGRDPWCRWY